MSEDKVYAQPQDVIKSFVFDRKVADVFDDMVSRSVPFYDEIHRIQTDLAKKFVNDGDVILDLGCSTATTIALLDKNLTEAGTKAHFVGYDNSQAMIEKGQEKINKLSIDKKRVKLKVADLTSVEFPQAQMAVMNYTLQFIEKSERIKLVEKLYNSLRPGGIFVLAEKIICDDDRLDELFVDLYYDFKRRNGYSELEISQKREALENVLVPLRPQDQISLLKVCGFKKVDMLFRWYNFATFIGVKV